MFFTSINSCNLKDLIKIAQDSDAFELRLDLCNLSVTDLQEVIKQAKQTIPNSDKKNIIATYRINPKDENSLEKAYNQIIIAIDAGVGYIDLEINLPFLESLVSKAKENKVHIIISYHNYLCTEKLPKLIDIAKRAENLGADIIKIVTTANNTKDGIEVLGLYNYISPTKLIAFAMGEAGKFTRIISYLNGAPICYTAIQKGQHTADGQFTENEFKGKIYPKPVFESIKGRYFSKGETKLKLPASKSISQRLIIIASLIDATTTIKNYTECSDSNSALNIAKELGAKIIIEKDSIIIQGRGAEYLNSLEELNLNVGESGLLARICLAIGSSIDPKTNIIGQGSILNRSFKEEIEDLKTAKIILGTSDISEKDQNKLPISILNSISKNSIKISGTESSQFITAMLIASLISPKNIYTSKTVSESYINLSIGILKEFGVNIIYQEKEGYYKINTPKFKENYIIDIEADWSSATYHIVGAIISNSSISLSNLDKNSHQPDKAIIDILKESGAIIDESSNSISPPEQRLLPFYYDATNSPDLFPILVCLALFCNGKSKIKGIDRLINKESNRLESIYTEFTKLGANISIENGDTLVVDSIDIEKIGVGEIYCSSHNDHRIAMSILIATSQLKNSIYLDNIKCINKSYPNFLADLETALSS